MNLSSSETDHFNVTAITDQAFDAYKYDSTHAVLATATEPFDFNEPGPAVHHIPTTMAARLGPQPSAHRVLWEQTSTIDFVRGLEQRLNRPAKSLTLCSLLPQSGGQQYQQVAWSNAGFAAVYHKTAQGITELDAPLNIADAKDTRWSELTELLNGCRRSQCNDITANITRLNQGESLIVVSEGLRVAIKHKQQQSQLAHSLTTANLLEMQRLYRRVSRPTPGRGSFMWLTAK